MLPFEQDLDDAARSVVIVSPYLQKGRIVKLLPSLQKAVASGVEIAIHTRTADSRELSNQESVCEAIKMMRQTGIVVHTHKELNQRYAVVVKALCGMAAWIFLRLAEKIRMCFGSKIQTLPVSSWHFLVMQKANSLSWKMFLCRGRLRDISAFGITRNGEKG